MICEHRESILSPLRLVAAGRAPSTNLQYSVLMKRSVPLFLLSVVLFTPSALHADSVADLVKAQAVMSKVVRLLAKYQQYDIQLDAPAPRTNAKGKYVLPYNESGALTEWATKTFNVQAGSFAGEKAGEAAGKAVASKVPFGGLASGLMKKKGKEMGAMAALGGEKFVRSTSSLSFDNLDDYAVYLHVKHGQEPGFNQALAAAMAIYPQLENSYDGAIGKAYQQALRARKK